MPNTQRVTKMGDVHIKLLYSVKQIASLPIQEFSMRFVKYSRFTQDKNKQRKA